MTRIGLTAATVVHDIRTGALVVSAASRPDALDVTSRVPPLSFMKVFLAASWWDHRQPDAAFACAQKTPARTTRMSIHDMLVTGCDRPGKEMAVRLRRAIGGDAMMADLRRFLAAGGHQPAITLRADMTDEEWGDTWSIGEIDVTATLEDLSRFLLSVGNARGARGLMAARTAARIRSAFVDTVRRGTARGSDADLAGTQWTMGGKTGSGPMHDGEPLNGLFAGLIFDSAGIPRFTIATFVKQGGYGGGNAARLSARIARFLAEAEGRSR